MQSVTIGELLAQHMAGKINLQPAYQRNIAWNSAKRREFLLAVHDNEPGIPCLVMHDNGSTLDVVDGQQRLATILEYLAGRIPLKVGEADKVTFDKLPQTMRDTFMQFPLHYKTTDNPLKTFLRLQSGVALNSAEKRHASDCPLNTWLADIVTRYAELWGYCGFNNDRFRVHETLVACLFMAQHGELEPGKLDALYDNFNPADPACAVLERLLRFMQSNMVNRQTFLKTANFRAVFLMLLDAHKAGRLKDYRNGLDVFLKKCAKVDGFKVKNRLGEERAQRDRLVAFWLQFVKEEDEPLELAPVEAPGVPVTAVA